ncbi:hypothetical protein AXFE_35410 [Acidithrix ferrooxidans]|uniref:Uncharacterized protein n=1 Tax=Acidithrix ferrooxidans TaxID=1280514 RepID=A0A0D8HCU6_9ACTN|nr:hypothetical protein AXFE_35410 [Acidithrix ferrooxidans]
MIAPKPMIPNCIGLLPAVPPFPVAGAPTGITPDACAAIGVIVVAVAGVVVVTVAGVVVVTVAGVVVVLAATVEVVLEVVVLEVVVAVGAVEQVGIVIELDSRVTAPVWAKMRPLTVAPVFRVTEVSANMVPAKFVVVPRVAELPTCQKTLHACAPFSNTTVLDEAVVRVEPL